MFALSLVGCSTIENLLSGDKIDYRTARHHHPTSGLEVPPDLTQLAKDSRYQQPSGTISASTFQSAASAPSAAPTTPTVAPQAIGDLRIERLGNERWLSSTLPPEQLYPLVRAFWKDSGFVLVQDRADAGVMETDWAENRAKLPNDLHPQHHRQGVRRRLLDRRARQVPHPRRAHRRPAATSTSRTAAWWRSTSASARKHRSGSRGRPIRSSKASSCRA